MRCSRSSRRRLGRDDVDEDLRGLEDVIVHADDVRAFESAVPLDTVRFAVSRSQRVTPSFDRWTTAALRAFTRFMSQ